MSEPWTSEADAKLAALEVALETMAAENAELKQWRDQYHEDAVGFAKQVTELRDERDRLLNDLNREKGFNKLLRIDRDYMRDKLAVAVMALESSPCNCGGHLEGGKPCSRCNALSELATDFGKDV